MVGPELDRLEQMKKDGVMTIQLTYNNRNLAGDGALEPANAGLSKLGQGDDRADRGGEIAARLSHGGARTMAEAAAFAKRPLVISHTGAGRSTTIPATPTMRRSARSPTRAGWSGSISCPS